MNKYSSFYSGFTTALLPPLCFADIEAIYCRSLIVHSTIVFAIILHPPHKKNSTFIQDTFGTYHFLQICSNIVKQSFANL